MITWEPSCSLDLLQLRATVLHKIRGYFYEQQVLEVETPILCQSIGTDPYIDFFSTQSSNSKSLYLQTSPEFSMKRLLSAHACSMYQITKAFRQGESGRYHNPEFTLLEWYRVGFDLTQLMDDVANFLTLFLKESDFSAADERLSYIQVFKRYTGLDALVFSLPEYQKVADAHHLPDAFAVCGNSHTAWLDFLFSACVQPHLGNKGLCMIYHYPAILPSLARKLEHNPLLVERVELFVAGVELGNGYFELSDVQEQDVRFTQDIALREKNNTVKVAKDERFLAALQHGLPDCSGIAIGLDRLLMLIAHKESIDEVLAFPVNRA